MVTKTCLFCGKEFEAKTQNTKYCSANCKEKARIERNRVEMTCLHCGKKFMGSPDWGTQFCSKSCATAHGRVVRKLTCIDCGKEFEFYGRTRKLRCDECWHKHRSKDNMRVRGNHDASVKVGAGSGGNQHPDHDIYDTEAHQKALAKRRESYRLAKATGTYGSTYEYRRILTGDDACCLCGYKEHQCVLVVHHKNMNRGDNSRENLAILCPNCHALIHAATRKLMKGGVPIADIWDESKKIINTLD